MDIHATLVILVRTVIGKMNPIHLMTTKHLWEVKRLCYVKHLCQVKLLQEVQYTWKVSHHKIYWQQTIAVHLR